MAENLRRAAQSAPSHGSFLTGVKGNGAAPAAPADPKAKPKPGRGSRAPKAAKGSDANRGTGDDKKPKPNYTRKLGGKISQLSTKATEIRCLQTQVQSALTLNLI